MLKTSSGRAVLVASMRGEFEVSYAPVYILQIIFVMKLERSLEGHVGDLFRLRWFRRRVVSRDPEKKAVLLVV